MAKGLIAASCGFNCELQVLKSGAGWYIGTFDPNMGPLTRESEEYYASKPLAEIALERNLFTQRETP